jgi:hypothetical protein
MERIVNIHEQKLTFLWKQNIPKILAQVPDLQACFRVSMFPLYRGWKHGNKTK